MSGRRRRDGDPLLDDGAQPRVRGAWTTPAVVVRAPDGSVVDPEEVRRWPAAPGASTGRDGTGEGGGEGDGDGPGAGSGTGPGAGRRRPVRPRPRRIPGAIGAALIEPRLLVEAFDGRLDRQARRRAAPDATVTRLPLRRPRRRRADGATAPAVEVASHSPGLRPVAGRPPGKRAAPRAGSGRGARRPSPARPGERRRSRMLARVANVDLSWLAGRDEETRERRRARLRWAGARLGVFVLVGALLYAIFPVRTYLAQRAATARGREQVEVIDAENRRLEKRVQQLKNPDTVEEIARGELGLAKPGEESYGILPAPPPSTTTTTTTAP